MDGAAANPPGICDLLKRYGALVMVDDSYAVGFIGPKGVERQQGMGSKIRLIFLPARWVKHLAAHREGTSRAAVRSFLGLRQRARPYFFSNSLMPANLVSLRWRPPSRIAFAREMICSLICKQMSKRDNGYGSVRS